MHTYEELEKDSLLIALSKHVEDTIDWLGFYCYNHGYNPEDVIDLYCHMMSKPYKSHEKFVKEHSKI